MVSLSTPAGSGIYTSTDFFQASTSFVLGSDVNPYVYSIYPDARYDSWLTIGLDQAPSSSLDGSPVSLITSASNQWQLNFEEEGEGIQDIRRRLSNESAVNQVGRALDQTLNADREGAEPREHFSPVTVRFPVNAPPLRPPPPPVTMTNYDSEDGVDLADALHKATSNLKGFNFDMDDLSYVFNQI